MHLVMFDIDGTLVESNAFDSHCFSQAVLDELNITVDTQWDRYEHVSDLGILKQVIDENTEIPSIDLTPIDTTSIDSTSIDTTVEAVRQRFVSLLKEHARQSEIRPIPGATTFIQYLQNRPDVTVSFATGGWYDSAVLKLTAAGFDVSDIPIASSDDHYSRTEIMKISEKLTQKTEFSSKTYFGDGAWDLQASTALDYQFVLVGDRIDWNQSIDDYVDIPEVLRQAGL